MTPHRFLLWGIRPALTLLPARMDSPEAEAMVLAIALQESRLRHRRQVAGPARGYPQFELGFDRGGRVVGGVAGVLAHEATRAHAQALCAALDITFAAHPVYDAMAYQDVLAAGMARLLLWTLPVPLPRRPQVDTAWAQYRAAWRPGKPHPHTWADQWAEAWQVLDQAGA